ncbi:MAG TPA: hypothetical protein VFA68_10145 [Terriglobales bacterium]|nr:hypothetical protein [Terriglobales bacterium]
MKSKLGFTIAAGIVGLGLALQPAHLLSQESRGEQQAEHRADQMAANNAGTEPHMAAALEHLRQAEEELEKATPNKGGHRTKALEYTHQAQAQVEQGIQYFRQHSGERR